MITTEPQRHRDKKGLENVVIPAKAGIHFAGNALVDRWIPAFAGMTPFFLLCFLCDRAEASVEAAQREIEAYFAEKRARAAA